MHTLPFINITALTERGIHNEICNVRIKHSRRIIFVDNLELISKWSNCVLRIMQELIDEEGTDCAFRPWTRPFTRLSCTSNMRFGRHMHMDRWCFHRVHKSRINMYETVCIEIIRYYLVSFYTRIVAIFFSYTVAVKFYANFDADHGWLLIPPSVIWNSLDSVYLVLHRYTTHRILY